MLTINDVHVDRDKISNSVLERFPLRDSKDRDALIDLICKTTESVMRRNFLACWRENSQYHQWAKHKCTGYDLG